jgi:hypothetical protein
MMRRRFILAGWPAAVLAAVPLLATANAQAEDTERYEQSLAEWRAERLTSLKGPNGYLNLVGLYWLQPGTSRFGGGQGNDLVFPGAPEELGEFRLADNGVTMTVNHASDVRVDNRPVDEAFLADDTSGDPVSATVGSLTWSVVKRGGRFAIRLRDLDSPALGKLEAIPYYPVDPAWQLVGQMRSYGEPRVANVATVIEGLGWRPVSPGSVEFEIDGRTMSLEAYESGTGLLFVFADRTSGHETYPAGRFLYKDAPDAKGQVVLDFNKAENPPCAFNDFATCPVASPRNRVDIAITAGEKFERRLHVGEL